MSEATHKSAAETRQKLTVRKLTGYVGAMIEGVDLASADAQTARAIEKELADHCVLVFRNQFLGPDEQIAFGRKLGRLIHTEGSVEHNVPNAHRALETHSEIMLVSNTGKGVNSTENWHADNCHVPVPTAISILSAQVIPEVGGDTLFSNQYVAYETLSDNYKKLLRGLRLKHTGGRQVAYRDRPSEAPFCFHPLVRTHPISGKRALFLGGRPGVARPHFEGMSEQESHPIQHFLLEHSIYPDRIYRHVWQKGDVLMWDNRCALHFAVHDYGDARRDMYRVTTEGEKPVETRYPD